MAETHRGRPPTESACDDSGTGVMATLTTETPTPSVHSSCGLFYRDGSSDVEIRYLYAYKGGSLYQPAFLGERDDIPAEECVLSQLKYKPEGCSAEEGSYDNAD